MPFKSKAQERFMFAKKPELAKDFAAKTPSQAALPEKAAGPAAPKQMGFMKALIKGK